ncbi:MAG: beta-ketoacyl synthase N-terminal-like domain-containing protein [Planctomycetota bacterium]
MNRPVVITGIGPISALGLGTEPTWQALQQGRSAIGPIQGFDASGLPNRLGAEIDPGFKVRDFVPKTYRKATKVMARDIELAVAAAKTAAMDAGLRTAGSDPSEGEPHYPGDRMGCHIGAGLIAVDIDEITAAMAGSRHPDHPNQLDLHNWGKAGMSELTPLWLLKYLPNMLACHVTIIHDLRGPSNTITCAEASGGLSVGESLRVIERGQAEVCFCGGADSRMNPQAFLRQVLAKRLTPHNDRGAQAVRPFDRSATGGAVGEGGAILVLEEAQSAAQRGAEPYARVLGFAASQTVFPEAGNRRPDPTGRGIAAAIRGALRDAETEPASIDAVVAFGCADTAWDAAEAAALRDVLGPDRLAKTPVVATRAYWGNAGAGGGALDLAVAAMALRHGALPPILHREDPIEHLGATHQDAHKIENILVVGIGFGGQNCALVLGKA